MFAKRTAAALTAAGALALTGCGAAAALDRQAAVTAVSDGTQAAVVRGWGPVVAGDEFNYAGRPDPANGRSTTVRGMRAREPGVRRPWRSAAVL